MKCSNAIEAEVFALLISCRELHRMNGLNDIIEGDSFSVIQWGVRKDFFSLAFGGLD